MQSLKLTIAYDGSNYCGWQMQVRCASVQGEIQKAFGKVLHQRVAVTASGRTDTGVHAVGQVASCRVDTRMEPAVLLRALNSSLPTDIRIVSIEPAVDGFHAIRHAQSKAYRYRIWNSRVAHVFLRNHSWHVPSELDIAAMQQALERIQGTHDFACFQGSGSPRKTTVRTLFEAQLRSSAGSLYEPLPGIGTQETERWPTFEFWQGQVIDILLHSNGFLYNMARIIAGTLVDVGKGKRSPESIDTLLASRNRAQAGMTAPPQGLTLLWVRYGDIPPSGVDAEPGIEREEGD